MKKGLSAAIAARKQLNEAEPEPEPIQPAQPTTAPKASATKKRFHTTLYPDPDMYRNIRIALLQEGQGRDFNQLVNELLADWYAEHGEQ